MSPIFQIRKRLGLNQTELGEAIGCKQANVSHYEQGQSLPPDKARLLIAFAGRRGLHLTFDHLYNDLEIPVIVETKAEA